MWWGQKQNNEWLPWYRAPGFKGKVSEAEKRQLDAFRMQERHPAASASDLPEEVRSYIARLEIENYDFKQDRAASGTMFVSVIGAVVLGVGYFGLHIQPSESVWPFAFGLVLLIAPWFFYRREWRRNADELFPQRRGGSSMADENIRKEWELDFLSRRDREED